MLATYPVELLSKPAQLVTEDCDAASRIAPDGRTAELYFCRYGHKVNAQWGKGL